MAPLLTIFTTPKPFEGYIDTIQRNAIKSWTLLEPRPEIILLGDEPGAEQAASDLGVIFGGEIARNEYGTPLVSDIFDKGQRRATGDLVCYINADVILFGDFMDAVHLVRGTPEFLMIGRRWDMDVREDLDFDKPSWESELKKRINSSGEPQSAYYIDYFLFTKNLYSGIPPLALGRMHWDCWLVFHARNRGALVIDGTQAVTALHQKHDYAHARASSVIDIVNRPEAKRNMKLAGGTGNYFSISSASRLLTREGLTRQKWTHYLAITGLKPFLITNPVAGFFFRPVWRIYDLIYPWRISRMLQRELISSDSDLPKVKR